MLGPISEKIEEIKAADPNHKKIRNLENKYAKLKKDLDRRLGIGVTAQEPIAPPAAHKQEQQAGLPGGVLKRLQEIEGMLEKVLEPVTKENVQKARAAVRLITWWLFFD